MQETLFEDQMCVAVRKGHPISGRKRLTKEAFLGLKYVILRQNVDDTQFSELVQKKFGMRLEIAVVASAVMTVPAVVAKTDYAAPLYSRLFAPVIPTFKLVTFPMPIPFPSIKIVMKHLARFDGNPALSWLRNEIRIVVREKNVRNPFVRY